MEQDVRKTILLYLYKNKRGAYCSTLKQLGLSERQIIEETIELFIDALITNTGESIGDPLYGRTSFNDLNLDKVFIKINPAGESYVSQNYINANLKWSKIAAWASIAGFVVALASLIVSLYKP